MQAVDELLHLPVETLKRKVAGRKGRGEYASRERRVFSRDELIHFLVAGGFRSSRMLMRARNPGEPTVYDYRKEFGSWSKALVVAFGSDGGEAPKNRMYVIRAVIEFNLWSKSRYIKVHKTCPDVVPSMRIVNRLFGSFGILKRLAAAKSLKKSLSDYLELREKIGRSPTSVQCAKAGIDLQAMHAMFGGKRQLNRFLTSEREGI